MILSDAYDLIHREYDRMVGFVRSRLRDSGDRDAEDVVQDVLTSVVEKLNVASPLEDFTAYIYRGLRNRIIDTFRRKRDIVSMDEPIGEEITLNDLLADFSFNPETDYETKTVADRLYVAMDKLSEDERDVIIAVEIDGYTFSELSDQWDESINTLLSRKSRGMVKLKKILNLQEAGNEL